MIRKFKKCGLYALLFVLLSIALFLGFSDDLLAYQYETQDLYLCSDYTGSYSNFPNINAANLFTDWSTMLPQVDFENPDASYFIIVTFPTSGNSGSVIAWYINDKSNGQFYWAEDIAPTNPSIGLAMPPNVPDAYQLNRAKSGNVSTYSSLTGQPPNNWRGQPSGQTSPSLWADDEYAIYGMPTQAHNKPIDYSVDSPTPHCVVNWQNISHDPNMPQEMKDALPFETNQPVNLEKPPKDCSPFDFGCWLTGLVDMVGETFGTLFEAIAKFFTWLFIPDSDGLNERISDIVDTLADRFGILWLPNDLLIHYFELFVTSDPLNWSQPNHYFCDAYDTSTNNPYGPSTSLFGETVKIRDIIPYCKALGFGGNYGTLTVFINYLLVFFRLSLLMAVLRLFYKKIHEEIII